MLVNLTQGVDCFFKCRTKLLHFETPTACQSKSFIFFCKSFCSVYNFGRLLPFLIIYFVFKFDSSVDDGSIEKVKSFVKFQVSLLIVAIIIKRNLCYTLIRNWGIFKTSIPQFWNRVEYIADSNVLRVIKNTVKLGYNEQLGTGQIRSL